MISFSGDNIHLYIFKYVLNKNEAGFLIYTYFNMVYIDLFLQCGPQLQIPQSIDQETIEIPENLKIFSQ